MSNAEESAVKFTQPSRRCRDKNKKIRKYWQENHAHALKRGVRGRGGGFTETERDTAKNFSLELVCVRRDGEAIPNSISRPRCMTGIRVVNVRM